MLPVSGSAAGDAQPTRCGRHVALKEVELVFPDHLAGVDVERHHALLQRGAAARRVLHVDPVAHDDRGRAAAVGRAPQEVLAVERPLLGEAGFGRDAVALRPARLGPVAERHPPRSLRRRQHPGHDGQGDGDTQTLLISMGYAFQPRRVSLSERSNHEGQTGTKDSIQRTRLRPTALSVTSALVPSALALSLETSPRRARRRFAAHRFRR